MNWRCWISGHDPDEPTHQPSEYGPDGTDGLGSWISTCRRCGERVSVPWPRKEEL